MDIIRRGQRDECIRSQAGTPGPKVSARRLVDGQKPLMVGCRAWRPCGDLETILCRPVLADRGLREGLLTAVEKIWNAKMLTGEASRLDRCPSPTGTWERDGTGRYEDDKVQFEQVGYTPGTLSIPLSTMRGFQGSQTGTEIGLLSP